MCASINDSPAPQAAPTTVGTGEEGARDALKNTPLGTVVSRDGTGRARMVMGAAPSAPLKLEVNAETAARVHLSRHASLFGLHEAAVRDAAVSVSRQLPGGGALVQFTQSVNGIEVFRSRATVVVDAAKNLVSASSTLHREGGATHAVKAMKFSISPEQTLANVYAGHFGQPLAGSVRDLGSRDGGELRGYEVATGVNAPRILQATAKRVLVPEGDVLTPAYYVEFLSRSADSRVNEGFGYAVAANDGRVLYKTSLTAHEAFKYRVWAETDQNNIPMDGPYQDYSPHPSGTPDKKLPAFRAPNDISMEGFNKNPQGKPDPWLAADATTTFGNNVRAYSDRSDTHELDAGRPTGKGDGYDPDKDIAPDVTAPHEFLRTYDVTKKPNENDDQIKAAVTDLFYVNNWLHDYWYDSGFDEAAGNAQLSNFGRGGKEGDPIRAEGQDGADYGQSNNANMTTFAEGTSPRMQMFVWSGIPNRRLDASPTTAFTDGYGAPAYGPQVYTLPAAGSAEVAFVIANDGTAPTSDGCQAITNTAEVKDKIVVMERSAACTFYVRTQNAQAAGAIGAVIINNGAIGAHEVVSPSTPDGGAADIKIPMLTLSAEDGKLLTDKLRASPGSVTGRMNRGEEILHDGTIDNTVIAHEWGHYLHHRLVSCGSTSCGGMSEGWADFNALMMVIREGDTLEGKAFPMAQYAGAGLGANTGYFGIRRAPYSTLFEQNPFTFKHVAKNSQLPTGAPLGSGGVDMNEVHNVGEIWAQALFEGYVNLHAAGKVAGRSFQETKRRMADYIVSGMEITPVEPTFIEQRDAILSAVAATGRKDDLEAIARGFAKRGFGVGAVAPPVTSTTLNEVKQSTEMGGDLGFLGATLDDSGTSCDHDGILDSGESGSIKVTVRNTGFSALAGTKVSVTTTAEGITIGDEGTVESIDALGDATLSIPIRAAAGQTARGHIPLSITLKNDAAVVNKTVTGTVDLNYNYDDVEKSSTTDDAESTKVAWSTADDTPKVTSWSRQGAQFTHVWHGDDLGTPTDERLVSPDLVVGQDDLVLTFNHRYKFEEDAEPTFYDGGVLEVSKDGGATWEDVTHFVDPGYPQTILDNPEFGNALRGRKAWAGTSPGYPNYETKTLNFGKLLAGKTIKIRFRIGTDGAAGAEGWDIDDIKVTGITNLPFPSVTDNKGVCGGGTDGGTDSGMGDSGTGEGGVDPGHDAGTDAGLDSGTTEDAGTDAGGSADSGPQGVPPRYTNSDSSCAVSPGGQGALPRGAGVGLFAGLMMLLGLRRRAKL
ncbi:M36 family metallopeptidase [Pendulispora brunnea]|uniref:M36 family metallopeptidase n=1 Tax=Pendulispora brunnea TaxID=2905690 RepID=A0ABZ2KLD8_9BACT